MTYRRLKFAVLVAPVLIAALFAAYSLALDRRTDSLFKQACSTDYAKADSAKHALAKLQSPELIQWLVGKLAPNHNIGKLGSVDPAGDVLALIGKPAEKPLLAALKSNLPTTRGGAVYVFGKTWNAKAIAPVAEALGDKDPFVRQLAYYTLCGYGKTAVAQLTITATRSRNSEARRGAVMCLGAIRDKAGVPAIAAALRDPSDTVAYQACMMIMLSKWKDRRFVRPLIADLRRNPALAAAAASSLGTVGDKRAVEPLVGQMRNPDRRVRDYAAIALGTLGDRRPLDYLLRMLKGGDDGDYAVSAVSRIGKPAIAPLASILKNGNPKARRRAASALSQMGKPEAVPILIAALSDHGIRNSIILDCAMTQDQRVVPHLVQILKKGDPASRSSAVEALQSFRNLPSSAISALAAATSDKEVDVRRGAVMAISSKPGITVRNALIAALKDRYTSVATFAAWQLGCRKDPQATDALIAALGNKEPGFGPEELEAKKHPNMLAQQVQVDVRDLAVEPRSAYLRREAAIALGATGDRRAVLPLVSALKDSSPGVRGAAAAALGRLKDVRAIQPLKDALKDSRESVRRTALSSLKELSGAGKKPK